MVPMLTLQISTTDVFTYTLFSNKQILKVTGDAAFDMLMAPQQAPGRFSKL